MAAVEREKKSGPTGARCRARKDEFVHLYDHPLASGDECLLGPSRSRRG